MNLRVAGPRVPSFRMLADKLSHTGGTYKLTFSSPPNCCEFEGSLIGRLGNANSSSRCAVANKVDRPAKVSPQAEY